MLRTTATITKTNNTSGCLCSASKVDEMSSAIDAKILELADKHLLAVRFDLECKADMTKVMKLLSLKRAFSTKNAMCSSCLDEFSVDDICSRILTIINQ